MNVHTRWTDAGKDAACIAWARDFFTRIAPHADGSAYVNFLTEDEGDRIGAAYGGNLNRLRRIKAKYDPANLFRANHNLPAAVAQAAAE